MKLTKIKLEHVRQFRAPFELANLSTGLNLFTGPNEAGKSTVVRAIRAAFFERYKTTSVDDLLPWGDSSATPTVELDFEVGSQAFHLRKCFLNKKRCELKAGDKQYDGEDAEQYLADLLGFEFAGKGSSKPEHWGIPGLLWIEQGAGQEIADSVGNATDHLRKVLDQSVGEVASTQGDAVIAKIHSERDALLTSTGRPRAVYAEAITERDALRVRVVELGDRIATYQEQVDQLGILRDEDLTDQQSKPWELLRAQQAEADQRLAAIETLKGDLDADELAFAQLKDKQKLIAEQLQAFDAQERDLKKRELAFEEARSAAAAQKGVCEIRDAARVAAETEYALANETLAISRQEDLRADLTRSAKQAQSRVATLSDTLVKAEAEQGNLVCLQKAIRDSQIEKKEIASLRDQQAKLSEIRIRREVAATRLRFNLLAGQSVTLDEEVLSGVGDRIVSFDTMVRIAGIGELQITPGGTDLAELAREEGEFLAENQALLARIGVATLTEAEARFALNQQSQADLKHCEKTLANLAPDGMDALRAELDEQRALHADAISKLDQLPQCPLQPAMALKQAVAQQTAAKATLETATSAVGDSKIALATVQTQSEGAERERDALLGLVSAPERKSKRADVNQNALTTKAERDALEVRIQARKDEVDAARPDILAQDVERFKRSADQSERIFRDRQTTITVLKSKLEEAGAQGLEEHRAELSVKLDSADRRLAEVKLRAEALDLLVGLLDSKRAAMTKRLQAPLQKHIQRYLQLLFPKATLDIGEDLVPGLLTRVGGRGPESGQFSEMSFGAREQMGVISRLAYADLLKEGGRPTLIIMDDALVHSDPQRLEQMQRVVFDASQRHQILVFTCHPANWRSIGADPMKISA